MEDPDQPTKKAFAVAERLLKIRPRSEGELRSKLEEKGIPGAVIDRLIEKYKDNGLVDDVAFSRQWVESRLRKSFGLDRIRLELRSRQVDPEVIKGAIAGSGEGYDEEEAALKLAEKRLAKYHRLPDHKISQRLYGYLRRRGFSAELIAAVFYKLNIR
jgi:regulatory protein